MQQPQPVNIGGGAGSNGSVSGVAGGQPVGVGGAPSSWRDKEAAIQPPKKPIPSAEREKFKNIHELTLSAYLGAFDHKGNQKDLEKKERKRAHSSFELRSPKSMNDLTGEKAPKPIPLRQLILRKGNDSPKPSVNYDSDESSKQDKLIDIHKGKNEIDWGRFDINTGGNVDELSHEMTFENSKRSLLILWHDLFVPEDHQRAFGDVHFSSFSTHSGASILGEINLLIMCRDKLIEILKNLKKLEAVRKDIRSIETLSNAGALLDELTNLKKKARHLHVETLGLMYEFVEDHANISGRTSAGTRKTFIYNGEDMIKRLSAKVPRSAVLS